MKNRNFDEYPPFKGSLKKNPEYDSYKMKNTENLPSNKLIKECSQSNYFNDNAHEIYIEKIKHFIDMAKKYQIKLALTDSVIGVSSEDNKTTTLYQISDKIIGNNIADTESLSSEAKDKLDLFYASLSKYLFDAYNNLSNFWVDYGNEQIVYGHKTDETEDDIYIVDTELTFDDFKPFNENDFSPEEKMLTQAAKLLSCVIKAECKTKNHKNLTIARLELYKILESLSQNKDNDIRTPRKRLDLLKERLNSSGKYTLMREDIISFSELPMELSDRKKSLGWPMEIQGTGRIKEGKDFEIRYPRGDTFYSFGAVLHEFGHLRQEEFNPEIDKIDKEKEWGCYIEIREKDAYQRGLERVKKYFPEVLEEMEKKFQEHKSYGKLKNFSTFEDLYEFLQGSININKALATVPEIEDKEEQDRLEYEALKKAGIEKFFNDIKESRVDEKIDKEWIEDFIMKMAEKISNE